MTDRDKKLIRNSTAEFLIFTGQADEQSIEARYEDEWLRGVCTHLEEIIEDPAEYVDYWDLENEEAVSATMIESCAEELYGQVDKILAMPMNKRGSREW
ncbi:MAG: hypothetical protein R6V60_16135 [Desulfobacterales bacterium]|jgi:hypothetical protein